MRLVRLNYRDTSLLIPQQHYPAVASFYFATVKTFRERRFRDYDAEYYVLRSEFSGNVAIGDTKHRIVFGLRQIENDQVFQRKRRRHPSW